MDEKITAWITRYALTDGIQKVQGKINQEHPRVFDYGAWNCAIGDQWHLTEQAAVDHAETIRIKKLQSLDSQHKKISALKFKVINET